MPVSIARQRIPKNRITAKSIATRYGVANLQAPYNFPTGQAHSFVVPKSGYWLFVAWSAGGKTGATYTGCSGAYGEITKALSAGQVVTITVGPENAGVAAHTVLVFPDGTSATCTNASGDTPGAAAGFDYSLNGSLGGATATGANGVAGSGTGGGAGGAGSVGGTNPSGGAGAPGRLPFRGGQGAGTRNGTFWRGACPGGGGCDSTTNDADVAGAGLVLAYLVRE